MPRPITSEFLGVKLKFGYLLKVFRRVYMQPGLRTAGLNCIVGLCLKNSFYCFFSPFPEKVTLTVSKHPIPFFLTVSIYLYMYLCDFSANVCHPHLPVS